MIIGKVVPRDLGVAPTKPVKKNSSGQNQSEFEDALVSSLTSAIEQVEDDREKHQRRDPQAEGEYENETPAEILAEAVDLTTATTASSAQTNRPAPLSKKLNIEA